MRKSIKGALELSSDVEHTRSLLDDFDAAHFISPDDENKLHFAIEKNKPIIVSALYSEDDGNAHYLEPINKKEWRNKWFLNNKNIRFLNKANVVLVPTAGARDFLINAGVKADIRVVFPGVNLTRFNFLRSDEKEVFFRYFGVNDEKKNIVAIGDCSASYEGFDTVNECAKRLPDCNFFYISPLSMKEFAKLSRRVPKYNKNLRLINVLSDDLYRSTLMNADAIIYAGINPVGVISVCDAMAAKTQIFARKEAMIPGFISNGEDGYVAENSDELVNLVVNYIQGSVQPTFEKAYEKISLHNLEKYGEELIKIYKEQILLKTKD